MPRGPASQGHCAYCEQEVSSSGIVKHLRTCAQRLAALEKAEKKEGRSETLYHLRVQDKYNKEFWLDLEMRGSAKLKDLDHYLRAIWLECCGHLSQFSSDGWRGKEFAMTRRAEEVFEPRTALTHIYDFGTSSETLIQAVEAREGKPTTRHPIALMARNAMPKEQCMKCKKTAQWLCMECLIEEDKSGVLCEEHVEEHEHDNYGDPVPLVNSPRVGMCGYEGPADPPY